MPFDIVILTKDDHEELVDFIDLVFGIDFKSVLPRLYQSTDECMSWQYAVKEGGKIRAAVGSFPLSYKVGEHTLKVGGIGNVAVHRDHRSKGYMKVLMNAAMADQEKSDVDFSWLTGQRQRYQYSGYEMCGASHNFSLKSQSLKHTLPSSYTPKYSFEKLMSQDEKIIDLVFEIHNRQAVKVERLREDFFTTLRTFEFVSYVVFDQGQVVGYLTHKEGRIHEIVLRDENAYTDVLYSLALTQKLDDISLMIFPHETRRLVQAGRIYDYYRIESSGNFRVHKLGNMLKAFLALKSTYTPLLSGSLVVGSDLFGQFEITVSGQDVDVRHTDKAADLSLTGFDIYQGLFGPIPIHGYLHQNTKRELILSWFPLPLSFPVQDRV